MNAIYILDACALIAVLAGEIGAENVKALMNLPAAERRGIMLALPNLTRFVLQGNFLTVRFTTMTSKRCKDEPPKRGGVLNLTANKGRRKGDYWSFLTS